MNGKGQDQLVARIDELESRITFQDETISRLDDALGEQQQQLLTVQRALSLLTSRLSDVESGQDEGPEPPPPDY